jgi:hypothetical protein
MKYRFISDEIKIGIHQKFMFDVHKHLDKTSPLATSGFYLLFYLLQNAAA